MNRWSRITVLALGLGILFAFGGASANQADPPATAEQPERTGQPERPEKPERAEGAAKGAVNTKALLDPKSPEMNAKAPDVFRVKLETSKGDVLIEVTRDLSPLGADRFYNLVRNGYYNDVRFFRVIPNFMAQFGIHGDPGVNTVWRGARIKDDPVKASNTRGMISFAMAGPNTRTTQLFINYKNNSSLDKQGFSPFGKVIEGMDAIDALHSGYGEGAPRGKGPDQGAAFNGGNAYLMKDFPKLDHIVRATVVSEGTGEKD
jgi:peptidyl-prolyl cis-trans isomerase A (cyclophilin A)